MILKQKGLGLFVLLVLAIGLGAFLNRNQNTTTHNVFNTDTAVLKIDQLTQEAVVVSYVKKHNQLPPYYITKSEARKSGWDASAGNLCEVLPGRAIGGDIFSNREGNLPNTDKRKWFEADLNYNCGRRNADRILFSNDGLIYVSLDHYKTFQQK